MPWAYIFTEAISERFWKFVLIFSKKIYLKAEVFMAIKEAYTEAGLGRRLRD